MNIRAAEKINDWKFEKPTRRGRGWESIARSPDGKYSVSAVSLSPAMAVAYTVNRVYELNRQIVYDRAQGKCENCGAFGPGEVHHKIFRSHGRNDRVDNLIYLGSSTTCGCHDIQHRRKKPSNV